MNFLLVKSIVTVIHFCPQKESWKFHYFLKINYVLVKNLCFCKLNIVSNILKSKESPRMSFEHKKGQSDIIYRPEFIDKKDHVILWNKDVLSEVSWLEKKTSDFSTI